MTGSLTALASLIGALSFTAAPDVLEGPGVTTLTWDAPGADRCHLEVSPDDSGPPRQETLAPRGSLEVPLATTSVVSLACPGTSEPSRSDVRVHVRPPPPPLAGPSRPRGLPLGLGLGLAAPAGATAELTFDPALAAGHLLGPFGWAVSTPYRLSVGASSSILGVGSAERAPFARALLGAALAVTAGPLELGAEVLCGVSARPWGGFFVGGSAVPGLRLRLHAGRALVGARLGTPVDLGAALGGRPDRLFVTPRARAEAVFVVDVLVPWEP